MATKHEPGTGNVGVSRLALAQRPSHDWRFADVVRDVTLRVPELRIGTVLTNLAAWGRERLPVPSARKPANPQRSFVGAEGMGPHGRWKRKPSPRPKRL